MIRSRRLDTPPATNSATPRRVRVGQPRRIATTQSASSKNAFPAPNTAVRTGRGQSAPRLKKAPVFSAYSRRNVSARNDRLGPSESLVAATCFVTRSQPIVAPIVRSRARQIPILVIIDLRKSTEVLDAALARRERTTVRTMAMGKRERDRQPTCWSRPIWKRAAQLDSSRERRKRQAATRR